MFFTVSNITVTLGDRIKMRRELAGLSQSELARRLEVMRQTLYAWETGKGTPNVAMSLKLAKILNTSISFLYGETEDPRPAPDWHKATGPSTEAESRAYAAASILRETAALLEDVQATERLNRIRALRYATERLGVRLSDESPGFTPGFEEDAISVSQIDELEKLVEKGQEALKQARAAAGQSLEDAQTGQQKPTE
jgi:transcriptional regulator with XRE-family HTH domain